MRAMGIAAYLGCGLESLRLLCLSISRLRFRLDYQPLVVQIYLHHVYVGCQFQSTPSKRAGNSKSTSNQQLYRVIVEFYGRPLIEHASSQSVSSISAGMTSEPFDIDNDLADHTYFICSWLLPPIRSTEAFQINAAVVAYGNVKNEDLYVTFVLNNWYSTVCPDVVLV